MIYLRNDYSEGMHPKILDAIIKTNEEQLTGYGNDEHCLNAMDIIRKRINRPDADVHLLVGGTQTNRVALTAFLRPIDAVISTNLGHIAVHETGSIEASGHKVIEIPCTDAKMTVAMVEQALNSHESEHMVNPRLVYISNATELGTVYTKAEISALWECCKKNNLYFYIDGARLANALTADKCDMTIEEMASMCDAFYIGATKNGCMMGEALVINNDELKANMRFYIKQIGGLLAKGRFLGIQFETLFEDDLYFTISKHTNEMAKLLADGLTKLGWEFVADVDSNMIFMEITKEFHAKLSQYCYYETEPLADLTKVKARFVTSYATPVSDVESFLLVMKNIM